MSKDKTGLFSLAWKAFGDGTEPTPEYNFDASIGRRHRFDWAFLDELVAVEVDGGGYSYRGGRHATDTDREKLNIAAALGWYVLRFSPAMLTKEPQQCVEYVLLCLAGVRSKQLK